MKEKKSFFGGLRRGNKAKGASDAVTTDTKSTEDISTIEDTTRLPDAEGSRPEADNFRKESDEIRVSEHTRPNETLGNLLSDIRGIGSETTENTENHPPGLPPDENGTVPDADSGEEEITLNDIIAGIRKNKSDRTFTPDETKPEHDPQVSGSLSREDTGADTDTEYYVCSICGYVSDGTLPKECPICGAPVKKFRKVI